MSRWPQPPLALDELPRFRPFGVAEKDVENHACPIVSYGNDPVRVQDRPVTVEHDVGVDEGVEL